MQLGRQDHYDLSRSLGSKGICLSSILISYEVVTRPLNPCSEDARNFTDTTSTAVTSGAAGPVAVEAYVALPNDQWRKVAKPPQADWPTAV